MSSDRDRYRDLGPQYADYEDEPPRPAISPGKVTRTSRLASPGRSRASVAPGKRTLASRIPAAPRGSDALPYRTQMQALFGEDFSGVQVTTNQAEELAPMGARAAAEGEAIRFASATPEPSLVAHELTHVVQQRQAGETALAAKKHESDPSDAAEREADAVAARVERQGMDGPRVVVRAQPTARVHFHRNGPPAHPENIARNRAAARGAANLTSVERGEALLSRAQALCKEVPSALLPAYRNAVDALDMMAAIELSHAIVTAVDEVLTAHLEIDRAFPANAPERWHKSTDDSPDGETEADIRGKWMNLRKQKAALEPETLAMKQAVAMKIGPRIFRGRPVMGGVEAPPAALLHRIPASYFASEAGTVVELIAVVLQARQLTGAGGGACQPLDQATRQQVRNLIEPWRSRPINWAFLLMALADEGIWSEIANEPGADGKTLVDVNSEVVAQAARLGALADLPQEDAARLGELTSKASDGSAKEAFDILKDAAPGVRGTFVRDLASRGRLDALCDHLPWQQVKALNEAIAPYDPQAAGMLHHYYAGKEENAKDDKSLHQIYMDRVDANLSGDGGAPVLASLAGMSSLGNKMGNQIDAFGWFFLDTAHNALTGGFHHDYGAAYDANVQGFTTDHEFRSSAAKALGKAAVISTASALSGGAVGGFGEGVAAGLGAGRSAASIIGGGIGGFAGGVGGHLAGDVFDQSFNGKQGFDSLGSYMQSGAVGGIAGTVTAGLSVAAGRYMPESAQRMGDVYAQRHPRMVRILDQVQRAGAGTGVRVRMTVAELRELLSSGLGGPGGPSALAMVGGGELAGLPADSEVAAVVSATKNLNAPANQLADADQPALVIERVEDRDLTLAESHGIPDGPEKFREWFNEQSVDDLAKLFEDPATKKLIKRRLRHGGGDHEWLMVSRADRVKAWGVKYEDIVNFTTPTRSTQFRDPATGVVRRHGPNTVSVDAHKEIGELIDSSNSFAQFKRKLNNWAEYSGRLPNGRADLPDELRLE